MRRVFGYVAFTVGWLLVFLAPLLYFYTKPRVEKAPIDVYDITTSFGTGNIFRATTTHLEGPLSLENISIAKSNKATSTHDIAVISIFDHTIDLGACVNPDEPDPLKLDCRTVSSDFTTYSMDRASGVSERICWEVESAVECAEDPESLGQTLKFPFGTKRDGTYRFFDVTTHKGFPAGYVRTEEVAGLDTFLFRSDVIPTQIGTLDVPGALFGSPEKLVTTQRWYKATTLLWVEPVTGAIVKAAQTSSQWLTNGDQYALTLANTNFVNSDDSVEDTASQVRTKLYQLRFVELWVPFYGPVVGLVLIVVGLLLLRTTASIRSGPVLRPAEVGT